VYKFTLKNNSIKPTLNSQRPKGKQAEIVKLTSPILARSPKEILEKLKFFKKGNKSLKKVKPNNRPSYAQVSASKVSEILKIKEHFPNLLVKKIENIYKMINDSGKVKPKINMTTKGPSQKQIIIPMSNDNKSKFMALLTEHITNLNSMLKDIK